MRVGKILFLSLLVSGLSLSAVYAQPADGNAAYSDDANGYKRADKATPSNKSYQTINKTLPYYVAPSLLSHPNLGTTRNTVVFNNPTTDLKSTWTWTEVGTTNLGIVKTDNKADITVHTTGASNVEVIEVSDCGNGEKSKIQIVGTGAPKLKIVEAEVLTVGTMGFDVTTRADVVAAAQGLKGYMYATCDPANLTGKSVSLKIQSVEEELPETDVLRKYSFSINCVIYRHKTDNTYTIDGVVTTPKNFTSAAKETVTGSAAGTAFTVAIPAITAPNPANNEDYVDVIFYLSGSEGRTGVVSAVSHRSDNPLVTGYTITDNPYDKVNDKLVAMVRLTDTPKTGPIYFIPYNY